MQNVEAIYKLSPMQQGMVFHTLLEEGQGTYFEQLTCTLRGHLDVAAFEEAWQRVVKRQPVLRTSFAWKSLDEILQVVQRDVRISLDQADWRGLSQAEQRQRLSSLLEAERRRGFDISRAPLARLGLRRIDDDAHYFVWSHHHALLDGWSVPLLLGEVIAFYEALRLGRDPYLPPTRPYRDYITWLERQDTGQAESFWRRTLAGFKTPTPIPIAQTAMPGADHVRRAREREIRLTAATTAALKSLAREHQLTLSTIIQGAWATLLSRYSGESDVVFGATVAGRPAELSGVENMIGLFINTLPLRVRLPSQARVVDVLREVQDQVAEARQYEYSSLVQIQEWSDVPRGRPLFDSILVFENYPVDSSLLSQSRNGSLRVENLRSIEQTNYPIALISGPSPQLSLKLSYDSRLFDPGAIDRLMGHLVSLLEGMATDPHRPVANLHLLSESERKQLLVDWNDKSAALPENSRAHTLFEAAAARQPDAVALTYQDISLTYDELNRRANQLAHYLQKRNIGPEDVVGICMESSPDTVVAVLGIMKAGGAYVPLDPSYPTDRLAYMVQDSGLCLILSQAALGEELLGKIVDQAVPIILVDREAEHIDREDTTSPESRTSPDNLAYVIYTSGSTGLPKGTLLVHRGLCNFVLGFLRECDIGPGSRLLQFASFSFDAAVADIFMTLLSGATLIMADRNTLVSIPDMTRLMQDSEVNCVLLPPAVLKLLDPKDLPDVRMVMSVGEACSPDVAARWSVDRQFFNGYGPTETTIGATMSRITTVPAGTTVVPIGRATTNLRLYVLDQHMRPMPIGVPGELYIGGLGVARGYLNRPVLTAQAFVPNPFGEVSGERLYRSGDLVRYRLDGQLEFLGRIGTQVKIRGFRVELGEIEATLENHANVKSAAVLAPEDRSGNRILVAYLVPNQETAPTRSELRDFLGRSLPDYMQPNHYVVLDSMPRTTSDKVDRKALPPLDDGSMVTSDTYVAPRSPVEEILVELWARVLGVRRVGIHDNFFELGGHSLLATQLISRLREVFQREIPLQRLFEAPTVADLAGVLETELRAEAEAQIPPLEPQPREGETPLSFAQQRLWFLDQLAPGNLFYNVPLVVRLTGALDREALQNSLNAVVSRHEVLRTTFQVLRGRPIQVTAPALTVPLAQRDLSHLPEDQREGTARELALQEIRQPFNLSSGPLLRALLLKLADQEHIAVINMHHIVSDGWSLGVLVRELGLFYKALAEGKQPAAAELPIQYIDFAVWQRQWLQGDVLERQLAYWRQQLGGSQAMLDLPTDRPRPAVQTSRGDTVTFVLPPALLEQLKALGRREGSTLFMTLMAAFQALLYRYTGQDDISIGTPIANRNRAEIEHLIGFFVNTLVMRTDLCGNPSFRELLARVRRVALEAYAHQDLPFEMLIEELQPQRDLSHTPLFQVAFGLQNAPVEPVELPGLSLHPLDADTGTSKFDLTLTMAEGPEGLNGAFEYNTDLFDRATIVRMAGHLQELLTGAVSNPKQPISELPLLTSGEQLQQLHAWNATTLATPTERCAHELFEARVAAQGQAPAIIMAEPAMDARSVDQGESPPSGLTYGELNARANCLAHYLRKLGVGPEIVVGLSTERSPDMIVGILGVLKAGGAYLPLDPTYPPERLAYMIEDSGIDVLLTQEHLLPRLPTPLQDEAVSKRAGTPAVTCILLDADWTQIAQEPDTNPPPSASPENLAYVIYTSGSTGRPKAVTLCHRGLSNLAEVQRLAFGIREGSRILQFSPLSFDASVWETFMALANGGTLCLARQEQLASGPELVRLLRQQGITTVTLPPSVLTVLEPAEYPDLEVVIAAGEKCTAEIVKKWAPGRRFFNAYGPTETTVCASMILCDPTSDAAPSIGRPIGNLRLYVLDRHLQPVAVGVPGELAVGGVSVARGYLNRPGLTAERFIPDPFGQTQPNDPGPATATTHLENRLYRTGDLVRYLPDGTIEFLGRIDHQVKVRGFRIELGEIEAVLRQHPRVKDAVVLATGGDGVDARLVAYVLTGEPTDGTELQQSALRGFLRKKLPEYMIPTFLVLLDTFPLTPSGKVDRRELPSVDGTRPTATAEYVAPRTDTERAVASICAELLRLDRVGAHDSFFELGGHSLLATQLISRVRDSFDVELSLRALFEHPTVAGLAEQVDELAQAKHAQADTVSRLLEQVEGLSDEQAQALLARLRSQ